jgi:hypothetical protein
LFHCWREMKMESFYSWEKKIWLAKKNVRPNRDNSDHVLINTIDVNLRDGWTSRTSFFLWSFQESQSVRFGVVM